MLRQHAGWTTCRLSNRKVQGRQHVKEVSVQLSNTLEKESSTQRTGHYTTNEPVNCVCIEDRTGFAIFIFLWSYVLVPA